MIRDLLKSYRKLDPDSEFKNLLLGVSGGADSIALLSAMVELRETLGVGLTAIHLNHKTRGKESDGDASFVRKICKSLGVRCVVRAIDVPALARKRRVSLEMAARDARYALFIEQSKKCKASAVVTAHNRDDQAETMVLKFARGAGLKGLSGIPATGSAEGVPVLRPLLGVTRKQIEVYLRRKGVDWREDSSNADERYLRNRVRSKVLPLLEDTLNPDIRSTLAGTADVLRADDELLEMLAEGALDACRAGRTSLNLKELKQEHRSLVRRVLMMWLAERGVDQDVIDLGLVRELEKLIYGRKANATVKVTGGLLVTREYDLLSAGKTSKKPGGSFRGAIAATGRTVLKKAGLVVETSVSDEVLKERGRPGRYPSRASISLRAIGRRKLFVRSWKDGDRIKPMGMGGSKKLKDVFIDLKIPASTRRNLPVVECAGEIVWVPGYRVARGWGVADGEKALFLTISHGK
jgi:tRNA(Ile)-lysidine synthase